ncbi:MAG: dihydrofolate reductase family protein [Micromonosporaceae bacterium]
MRKVVVANFVSLDGYFEGPGNNVMALPFDAAFSDYNAERMREADTLLLGRTTFENFRGYWPSVADDPNARDVDREISRLHRATDRLVVSDSLTLADTAPWQDNTRIVPRADAHAEVAALRRGPGRDILVLGSHHLWNDLLVAGLVDELHLMIGAGVVGGGTPAFGSGKPANLRLLDTRTWDGQGVVLARYAVPEAQAG